MDEAYLKRQLALNRDRIAALARGVLEDQARWKPDPDSWSILEVVSHLADEEEFDFPVRLKIILESPEKSWPEIDPEGWVTERRYNKGDLYGTLNRFMDLRNQSLIWLDSVKNPDWDSLYQASFGEIAAGDMFLAWTSHDLLHLRQLVELHRDYLVNRGLPWKPDYAGSW
jgi:hypothetical protein